jgi:SAM-dependent methyltransferase
MIEGKQYTEKFYNDQQEGSFISANEILGYVNDIFHPGSVIDVGCGVGFWLKVWKERFNVENVFGLEGPYISESMLKVSKQLVQFTDLKQPIVLKRKFDLAMSLEVAEHLPSSSAENFVHSLTQLSDIVLFSAAIVGQGGTYHINEQMPEYWAEKFEKLDYVPVDYLRPIIWNNDKIEWWYRQNILLFIKRERLKEFPELERAAESTSSSYLFRVQPWLYFHKNEHIKKTNSVTGYLRWKLYPVKKFYKKLIRKK